MADQTHPSSKDDDVKQRWLCDVCKVRQFDDYDKAVEHENICQGPPPTSVKTKDLVEEQTVPKQEPSVNSKCISSKAKSRTTRKNAVATDDRTANSKPSKAANAFFAPRSKKEKSKEKGANKKKGDSKDQAHVNPFFARRTAKSTNTSDDGAKKTSKRATEGEKKLSGREKRPNKSSAEDRVMMLDGDDSDTGKVSIKQGTKNQKKASKSTVASKKSASLSSTVDQDLQAAPQIASIFQNKSTKQIMAEQKQAQFQAKREAERQRERERQAKRAALFGSSSDGNGQNGPVSTLKAGGSLKRKQAQSGGTSSRLVNYANLPLAPRFPVPNHVWKESQHESSGTATTVEPAEILPTKHPFRRHSSSQPSTQDMATDDDSEWNLACSELDAVEDCTLSKIQLALQEILIPPSDAAQKCDTRLWVDKYGMQHGGVVGASATQTCQQLTEYINHWRKLRKEAVERMAERQRKRKAKFDKALGKKPGTARKPKRRKKKSYSDDDDDFLDDDEHWDDDEFGKQNIPLCLLTGPPSSGKTSIVHHVAKHCMCSVVEINTTEIRSGAALKNTIEEATKSSSLDTMLQSKENQAKANFFNGFGKATKAVVDSDDEESGSATGLSSSSQPSRDAASMTIVLLDEADIVFDADGDSGFWAALSSLAKSAKSPIILTANQCPPQFQSTALPCRFFSLDRPGPMECATKILQICRHEGVELDPLIRKQGPDSFHEKLSHVASACDCDLRRIGHELQVFSYGRSGKSLAAKRDAKEDNPSQGASARTDWRPGIVSIEPCKVPMDKHTVVTVKGRNFEVLLGNPTNIENENGDAAFSVWIGARKCKSHVVDDETLLVLCPPYSSADEDDCTTFCSRLVKRVLPLSIECGSIGMFKTIGSKVVQSEMMVNGISNIGIHWNLIEYVFPEEAMVQKELNESNDSIEEFEMDDEVAMDDSNSASVSGLTAEGEEQGIALWESVLSGLTASEVSTNLRGKRRMETLQVDLDTLQALDAFSLQANRMSDAAFLEDFQNGIPFLSGACRGFGFAYTEDCLQNSTDGDKLRFHENSRPPREEKLFDLGWKDNCYFYGDPETYMTSLSMKAGKETSVVLDHFRGKDSVDQGIPPAPAALPIDDIECREDLDYTAHHACNLNVGDSYIPRPIPPIVQAFPKLLRDSTSMTNHFLFDNRHFETNRTEKMERLQSGAQYILPEIWERVGWSYGRLGLCCSTEKRDLVLELLPTLRRIGLYEQAAEFAELQKGDDSATNSNRRTTRRQAKARRHHYFDKLSLKLRRDEADMNSSELGSLMAKDMLVYSE